MRVCRLAMTVQLGVLLILAGCGQAPEANPSRTAPETPPPPGTNAVAEATSDPQWLKLKARWLRPDGGYILELKSIEKGGRAEAAYFNPNPIHVARAAVVNEGSTAKVFVELRDVGYPGCTYALKYDPASDQLFGQYYQAMQQQTYDVVFERVK